MDIGSIKAKIELDASNYKRNVETVKKQTKEVGDGAEKTKKSFQGLESALTAVGSSAALYGLTRVIKSAVDEASRLQMSMQGLIEVSKALNVEVDKSTKLAEELASRGFMTIQESAEAVKTSLAAGLNLEETTDLINALADAAAYNRESHLGWGEAVVQALRGIKQGNSTLTDAAGITTNLSVMHERYADSIGKSVGTLSEAEKVQAAYNGMMQEATLFAGNAESAMEGYEGKLAEFNQTITMARAELGEAFIPALEEAMEKITPMIIETTKWLGENKELVAGLGSAAIAGLGMVSFLSVAVIAVNALRVGLVGLNLALGPIGWVAASLSVIVPSLLAMDGAMNLVGDSSDKASHKTSELAREYDDLNAKLDTLESGTNEAVTANNRMRDIMDELKRVSPDVVKAYNDQEGAVRSLTRAQRELTSEKIRGLRLSLEEKKAELDAAKNRQVQNEFWGDIAFDLGDSMLKREIDDYEAEIKRLNKILYADLLEGAPIIGDTWGDEPTTRTGGGSPGGAQPPLLTTPPPGRTQPTNNVAEIRERLIADQFRHDVTAAPARYSLSRGDKRNDAN